MIISEDKLPIQFQTPNSPMGWDDCLRMLAGLPFDMCAVVELTAKSGSYEKTVADLAYRGFKSQIGYLYASLKLLQEQSVAAQVAKALTDPPSTGGAVAAGVASSAKYMVNPIQAAAQVAQNQQNQQKLANLQNKS